GVVDEYPASLALFNHAIAYVPSLGLYLDGTAEFSGVTELPFHDQGIAGLIVDGGEGQFVQIPTDAADRNVIRRSTRILLGEDGSAQVAEDVNIEGQAAAGARRAFQAPGERRDRYEKLWNGFFAGARVTAVTMDLDDLDRSARVHAEGTVPQLGRASRDGGILVTALGRPSELAVGYASSSRRQHDTVLDYRWVQDETVVFRFPAGMSAKSLPRPVALSSPFGSFKMSVETIAASGANTGEIKVSCVLRFDGDRIPARQYSEWRDFLVAVDSALNQGIEVRR
ncbi:MAG: hypothetical protein V2A73_13410, partial [Pseudomonadota bacterium]